MIHTHENPRSSTQNGPLSSKIDQSISIKVGENEEKPFKCDICHKSYTQKGILSRHMRAHTDENPFKCDNKMDLSISIKVEAVEM